MADWVIAVHGGAGALADLRDDAAEQARIRDGLRAALAAGQGVLSAGGAALDAVERAVCVLEACESFNAGRGSALTADGTVEMDASIMCGARLAAGAVACVTTIVHPVAAARVVMEKTGHLLMVGAAAEAIAARAGLEIADPTFFVTPRALALLERARRDEEKRGDGTVGTVGAVALDRNGHLAAATSTGGMTNQARGRVGDSPIIGAGTWAADGRCAVSATGAGELIMRACLAHEIDARVRLAGVSIEAAGRQALDSVRDLGGVAGCIAIDSQGAVAAPFLTAAMPRGIARHDAPPRVAIYDEAP